MKNIILILITLVIPTFAFAEAYQVTVIKRSESNLYIATSGSAKIIIKTKYCYEYAYYEEAVLLYDKYSYDNKLILKSGSSCDVDKVYSFN